MTRATALVTALAAAFLATPAAAQEDPEATWGGDSTPGARLAAPPDAQAAIPAPRADGLFSLELLLGGSGNGGGGGLRASLGLELGEGWRLELGVGGLAENGSGGAVGGELQLGRAFAEVGVGRRIGRIEPWAAVGVARFSADFTATAPGQVCIPGTILCGEVDGLLTEEASGEAVGPQLAAGVRVALTDSILAGLTLRKAFVEPGALGALAGLADPGAAWLGLTLAWRPRGGR